MLVFLCYLSDSINIWRSVDASWSKIDNQTKQVTCAVACICNKQLIIVHLLMPCMKLLLLKSLDPTHCKITSCNLLTLSNLTKYFEFFKSEIYQELYTNELYLVPISSTSIDSLYAFLMTLINIYCPKLNWNMFMNKHSNPILGKIFYFMIKFLEKISSTSLVISLIIVIILFPGQNMNHCSATCNISQLFSTSKKCSVTSKSHKFSMMIGKFLNT